jgi:histidinol-phosphate aminotransferase
MRIGLAFGHPAFIRELMKVKDSYNVNRLSIVAAVAALEDYAWMQQHVGKIRTTRARLSTALREFGYVVYDSHANFVLAREPGVSQEPIYQALKAQRILIRYFSLPVLSDCLRITVGTDEEIDQFVSALEQLKRAA